MTALRSELSITLCIRDNLFIPVSATLSVRGRFVPTNSVRVSQYYIYLRRRGNGLLNVVEMA